MWFWKAMMRLTLPLAGGSAIAILIAANWPDSDSPAAGVLLGFGGVVGGGMVGAGWMMLGAEQDDEKEQERRREIGHG